MPGGPKIEQLPDGRYRLRWYLAGRGSPAPSEDLSARDAQEAGGGVRGQPGAAQGDGRARTLRAVQAAAAGHRPGVVGQVRGSRISPTGPASATGACSSATSSHGSARCPRVRSALRWSPISARSSRRRVSAATASASLWSCCRRLLAREKLHAATIARPPPARDRPAGPGSTRRTRAHGRLRDPRGAALRAPRRRAVAASRLPELAPADLAQGTRGGRDREPAAIRPASRLRVAPDPSRYVDPPSGPNRWATRPQMAVGTYAHVIRELKRQPVISAEEQIARARRENGGRLVDVDAV